MFGQSFIAAALTALLFITASISALADQDDRDNRSNEQSEDRDTRSRHETQRLDHITVTYENGRFRVEGVVLVQAKVLEVAKTSFGVEFESYDKLDLSGMPLVGGLFGKPLKASDFDAQTLVGTAYIAGDNRVAAVIHDDVDTSRAKVSVVNGAGRYQIAIEPRILETSLTSLGEFGTVPSVQQLVAGTASPDTTLVLGGLTKTTVPKATAEVPLLNDIPVLQRLFLGTVHRGPDRQLMILIRPSIVMGDKDY